MKTLRPLRLRDMEYASEAFFTGTAAEITPIVSVDHRRVGSGTKGPITAMLQRIYLDITQGKNQRYRSWLTFVPKPVAAEVVH